MKEDINIAEILKNMPIGTKLYSPICGECELVGIDPDFDTKKCITVRETTHTGAQHHFWKDGKFFKAGECVLWPGKHMDDWSKITWKKGDVLVSKDGRNEVIFDHFNSDDSYYTFVGKYLLYTDEDGCKYTSEIGTYATCNYSIEEKDAAQCYINTIEERFEGKLNPDTLDIEKQEEHIFEPFERVLVRDMKTEEWIPNFFYTTTYNGHYKCLDYSTWLYCIPYEGNEHLLGTTDIPRNL